MQGKSGKPPQRHFRERLSGPPGLFLEINIGLEADGRKSPTPIQRTRSPAGGTGGKGEKPSRGEGEDKRDGLTKKLPIR